jgi:superfamily II DNA helicase RecQ
MILPAVPILFRKSIAIILLPLNQIGEEQAESITRIGGKPCFLNAETISRKLLNQVQQGLFTHTLINPELAISDDFRRIASNPAFKEQLSLVVVDEAHLVSQWGRAFRPAYARLNQLRSYLGMAVPWFACSATLDPDTLEAHKKGVSPTHLDRSPRASDSNRLNSK